jgi:hypothetical protein
MTVFRTVSRSFCHTVGLSLGIETAGSWMANTGALVANQPGPGSLNHAPGSALSATDGSCKLRDK